MKIFLNLCLVTTPVYFGNWLECNLSLMYVETSDMISLSQQSKR